MQQCTDACPTLHSGPTLGLGSTNTAPCQNLVLEEFCPALEHYSSSEDGIPVWTEGSDLDRTASLFTEIDVQCFELPASPLSSDTYMSSVNDDFMLMSDYSFGGDEIVADIQANYDYEKYYRIMDTCNVLTSEDFGLPSLSFVLPDWGIAAFDTSDEADNAQGDIGCPAMGMWSWNDPAKRFRQKARF